MDKNQCNGFRKQLYVNNRFLFIVGFDLKLFKLIYRAQVLQDFANREKIPGQPKVNWLEWLSSSLNYKTVFNCNPPKLCRAKLMYD